MCVEIITSVKSFGEHKSSLSTRVPPSAPSIIAQKILRNYSVLVLKLIILKVHVKLDF